MIFDDLFYPGNPSRRQQVADLRGQVRADFTIYKNSWNDCANLLNTIFGQQYPQYHLQVLQCSVDNNCIQDCLNEFQSALADGKQKLDKLVRDIGLENGINGLVPSQINMDPDAIHKINQAIAGAVDSTVFIIAFYYIYASVRLFATVISLAGVAVSALAEILGGVLGGLIAGAVGFVITDIIASAISGAIERKQLNEAIDALTEFRDRVADPLLQAAGRLGGIAQSIRDGAYKVSDTLIIVKVGDSYQVIQIPASTNARRVQLVRRDFSDCINSDVVASDPAGIGGFLLVARNSDGSYHVDVNIQSGTPSTAYHFYLKCQFYLGDVVTDGSGAGRNTFTFAGNAIAAGAPYAFDMYPEGAPAGNKFQSEQVRTLN